MEKKVLVKELYVSEKEVDSELLKHMTLAHPKARVSIIKANTHAYNPKYGNVSAEYKDHFREKGTKAALLHRAAKWKPDPNGNSTDFLPGLMMTQGCAFGCTYCYTERHYLNNYPKLYGDVYEVVNMVQHTMDNLEFYREKMISLTHRDFEKYRDPKHGDWITFDLGCDSDCTLDNQLTAHDDFPGHVVDIMNKISAIPNAKTSFATKSASFDSFIKNCIRPSHHRIRLSVMPEHHRRILEMNTALIQDRLEAANKLHLAGFEVHLNLSPIVVTEKYDEEYSDLLKLIDSILLPDVKKQMAYEVIYLTHSNAQFDMVNAYAPKAHKMMTQGCMELTAKPNKPNVLSYSKKDKLVLKQKLRGMIEQITPYARVRYCY